MVFSSTPDFRAVRMHPLPCPCDQIKTRLLVYCSAHFMPMLGEQARQRGEWARSSAGEHFGDIEGVVSSILTAPTIFLLMQVNGVFDPRLTPGVRKESTRKAPERLLPGGPSVAAAAGRGSRKPDGWASNLTGSTALLMFRARLRPVGRRERMKVVNSLKTAKKRHRNCRVVRRRGRVYVINKTNRRFKARQG